MHENVHPEPSPVHENVHPEPSPVHAHGLSGDFGIDDDLLAAGAVMAINLELAEDGVIRRGQFAGSADLIQYGRASGAFLPVDSASAVSVKVSGFHLIVAIRTDHTDTLPS